MNRNPPPPPRPPKDGMVWPSESSQERKPDFAVTVRREIDRLARQMGRMTDELKKLKDAI